MAEKRKGNGFVYYPPQLGQADIQGTVRLGAVIAKVGKVSRLEVIDGNANLIPPALDSVRQWVYEPTLRDGKPVEVATEIEVKFAAPPPVFGGVPGGVPGGIIGGVLSSTPGPTPSSGGLPQRIRVGGGVAAAKLISQTKPDYPPLAKMARIQGSVRLEAIIGKDGTVLNLKVISGHPLLAKAAMDAVVTWRYQPTLLNGEPVEVDTEVVVNFTLADDKMPPNPSPPQTP